MIVKFNLSLLKEILWWLLGLFPVLFLLAYIFGYYGSDAIELIFKPTLDIQLHDVYFVIDTWMFWSALIVVPLGLSLTLKILFNRYQPKGLIYAILILLLLADYELYSFYKIYLQLYSLPIIRNANPTPWIFWLLVVCIIATLIVAGLIGKRVQKAIR